MTVIEALIRLNAIQSWLRLPLAKNGTVYGAGFFYKRNWFDTLKAENRRVSLRLARKPDCLRCGAALGSGSTGDHLIPLVKGGPIGAQNYLPLCRSCNSSKGRRDFLEWWQASGRAVSDLPPDVIISYVRLRFQTESLAGSDLARAAEPALTAAIASYEKILPRPHWRAVCTLKAVLDSGV